jgi:hypothetical protein
MVTGALNYKICRDHWDGTLQKIPERTSVTSATPRELYVKLVKVHAVIPLDIEYRIEETSRR